jgi:hypothetical protein
VAAIRASTGSGGRLSRMDGDNSFHDFATRDTALRRAIESTANAATNDVIERARAFLDFLRGDRLTNAVAIQEPGHPQTSSERHECEHND